MKKVGIGLVGAGSIARRHLDVIRDMADIEVVGITSRTFARAEELASEYGISVCATDIDGLMAEARPDALMVLVSADQIYPVCVEVIPRGLPLFIEKPPGLKPEETKRLSALAEQYSVPAMVGYNRRFYSIFHKGIEIIHRHGPLRGLRIEGHERIWKLSERLMEPMRSQWIYANATHTIDLLRFFGGEPSRFDAACRSVIETHGDHFAAVMEFESGAIGSYEAYWYSPGGWGVVLYGDGVTVEFKPLESGRWIDRDFKVFQIEPDERDVLYKPGFYGQMASFCRIAQGGRIEWPAQDLASACNTMNLARKLSQGKCCD